MFIIQRKDGFAKLKRCHRLQKATEKGIFKHLYEGFLSIASAFAYHLLHFLSDSLSLFDRLYLLFDPILRASGLDKEDESHQSDSQEIGCPIRGD